MQDKLLRQDSMDRKLKARMCSLPWRRDQALAVMQTTEKWRRLFATWMWR